MCRNEKDLYYVPNSAPVVLLHQAEGVTLGTEQTNYHVWAVCYNEHMIYLDFYHGIADGTGMYMVLSTLLYYYCHARYGLTDHKGIRTLEDPIDPLEYMDPYDSMPDIDLSRVPSPNMQEAFNLIEDGGFTAGVKRIFDVAIPETDFVRFSSANDASPGIMVSILLARAIDDMFPDRKKGIMSSYVINARPMLHAPKSHHNCVSTVFLDYSDKIKAMPFDRQCTVYRGKTFIQSDEERIQRSTAVMASRVRMLQKMTPTAEGKMELFAKMLSGGRRLFTFMVSYVGKWKHDGIGRYITEFWTHVPLANAFLIEVAAVNGTIYLSMQQAFQEDDLIKNFEKELSANGISCTITENTVDIAHFPMSDKK